MGVHKIYETPEALYAAAQRYFAETDKYTMAGLCLHLGITKMTLSRYGQNEELREVVELMKATVESSVEELLLYGKNQTGAIFWLKNQAGYKDVQHTDNVHRGRVVLSDTPVDEEEWQKQNS